MIQQFHFCKKQNHYLRKICALPLCDHLEGWDREGGREAQEEGDMGVYGYI